MSGLSGNVVNEHQQTHWKTRGIPLENAGKMLGTLWKHTKNNQKTSENGPFIVDLPIKVVIFHSYVSLPEGKQTVNHFGMCVCVFETSHLW